MDWFFSSANKKRRDTFTDLSDEDIAGQALLFFFAGFDTSSRCISFTAYELAVNTDIQRRLHDEIVEVTAKNGGELTYDSVVHQMKYLDMVISGKLSDRPTFGVLIINQIHSRITEKMAGRCNWRQNRYQKVHNTECRGFTSANLEPRRQRLDPNFRIALRPEVLSKPGQVWSREIQRGK